MPLLIQPDICKCCRLNLWHCEDCWNNWHNGLRDKDYEPPRFVGETFADRLRYLQKNRMK